jgi:hypothetical protein
MKAKNDIRYHAQRRHLCKEEEAPGCRRDDIRMAGMRRYKELMRPVYKFFANSTPRIMLT